MKKLITSFLLSGANADPKKLLRTSSELNCSTTTATLKRLSLLSIATLLFTGTGFSQFTGLESEIHATSEYGTTYRVYAHFNSPTDEVLAVYSIGQDEEGTVNLNLETTTSFYQDTTYGVDLASGLTSLVLAVFPNVAYDSWLTIGSDADASVFSIGMTGAFTDFNTGSGFTLDGLVGGGWYVTPGVDLLAMAGDDGKVLLAQLTAAHGVDGVGHVICDWNLFWIDASGNAHYEQEITLNTQDFVIEVLGCTVATACNYNAAATDPGVECIFPTGCESCSGETNGTGVIVFNDTDQDGVCDADEILGCQDSLACNFNALATDEGTCVYVDGVCETCSGETDGTGAVLGNDSDNDGVCDAIEIVGCQDLLACNYNASATDAGTSCVYAIGSCATCSGSADDGTGTVAANDADGDGVCDQDEITGCQNDSACNYDSTATDAGYCDYAEAEYDCTGNCLSDTDQDGVCDEFEVAGCTVSSACNYDSTATDDDGSCTFAEAGLDCSGGCLIDSDSDGICDQDEITGCQNDSACNYDSTATDAGYCDYAEAGYDCTGNCLSDTDQDGVCDEFEVAGCTVSSACNYDSTATDDDGSCTYAEVGLDCSGGCLIDADSDGVCDQNEITGCQNDNACNYDSTATDAGYCDYAEAGYDCTGDCLSDTDQDGVCDEFEVAGCTVSSACNYDSTATDDDGSCTFAEAGLDCSGGCLIDSDSDGICDQDEITGCQNDSACNYDSTATDAGYCDYAEAGYDCTGNCLSDTDQDGVCDEFEVAGCTVSSACNYDSTATDDDGSCAYAEAGLDCSGGCLIDSDSDGVCDQDEITGCQNDSACNYDSTATDAGYCDYAEVGYDCTGDCLSDTDQDGVCDEFEVLGCTTSAAFNYDSTATDDDGSCLYYTIGCAYNEACNYDSTAELDDGSCLFAEPGFDCLGEQLEECQGSGACVSDIDGDGLVGVGDMLYLLSEFGMSCD